MNLNAGSTVVALNNVVFTEAPSGAANRHLSINNTVIGTFKAFNHIWVMTQGGPVDATTTASIYIFKQLFQFNRYGYSAALSFILFAVILALTIVQNRFAGQRVVYD
jgi:multiple sugar transport system permease protein